MTRTTTAIASLMTLSLLAFAAGARSTTIPAAEIGHLGAKAAEASPEARAARVGSLRVVYSEQELGTGPVTVEVIVTPAHVRFGTRDTMDDFVLFDRNTGVIYSVLGEERSIVVVNPKSGVAAPLFDQRLSEVRLDDSDLPTVSEIETERFRYLLGDRVCMEVVTAKGFMPEAVSAYREYRLRLADEHKAGLSQIPMELQDPCDLAVNVYEPIRHLEHGFPVIEVDYMGRQRMLIDYESGFASDTRLLRLPGGYRRQTTEDLRTR